MMCSRTNRHADTEQAEDRAAAKPGNRARCQCLSDSEGTAADNRGPSRAWGGHHETGNGAQLPGRQDRRLSVALLCHPERIICHPERSEGPMYLAGAHRMHRSFAALRMTNLGALTR